MTRRRSLFALWAALTVLWVGYVLAQPVSYYDDFASRPHHSPADLDDDHTLRRHKDALDAEVIRNNPGPGSCLPSFL